MPISLRHTQMLFVMPVHFQKAAGCPITDSVPNWHVHRLMYRTHNETLFVFFFYDIESRPHFAVAAVGLGAAGANKDQRPNVLHMSG